MDKVNPLAKNYYERLGLSKDATYDQIRKIYRKCVMKFHPDRNPDDPKAEEKMKMINEAYEILSDSEKRDIYDRHGEEGLKGGGGPSGFPFGGGGGGLFDFFGGGSSFFGGGGDPRGGGGGGGSRGPKKCPTIQRKLQVTLEDVYNGRVRRIRVTRKRICSACKGKGASKATGVKKCDECDGKGKVVRVQRLGPGFISKSVQPCQECHGEGTIIDSRYRCKTCKGDQTVEQKKTLEVHIDKGMKTGQKIEFEGESDEKPGMKAGDIIFVLFVGEHRLFKRDGLNLEIKKKINLSEALTGVEFLIEQLDKRKLHVKSSPGEVICPGQLRMVKNEGMPRYKYPYEKGNLLIRFEIEFPKRIPKSMQKRLIEMLPEKTKVRLNKKKKKEHLVEEVILEAPERVRTHGRRSEAYDSDDEEDGERGQTISCSIQ